MSIRRIPLTPLLLALAAWPMIQAAEGDSAGGGQQPAPVQMSALASEAAYAEAYARYRKAEFVEAREKIEESIRLDPGNAKAQALREDILAVLSQRSNRLQMAATWFRTLQDVRTQEIAVRIDALIKSGDAKFAVGDYSAAELEFDRAEVALRSFPYPFDWGKLPAEVAGKRVEAAAANRKQVDKRATDARQEAQDRAHQQADLQEQALKAKVDELLRRAKESYSRKDFKRAEVDAWNAYELDRRREDARSLYLDARREGHESFDDKHEDERIERIGRISEDIHRSLIPQSELLVYPEDWNRRQMRKQRTIGAGKEQPWMAALRDRLDQRVTFEYQDQPFDDVIKFLREVTGVNIVVASTVTAGGAAGAGGVATKPVGNVTLKVRDMRFGDALKWILEMTNLHMALQDQAIFISPNAVTGLVTLKMYDVTDLIQQARDLPGRELAYGSTGSGLDLFGKATSTDEPKTADPKELMDFIKKNVAPGQWDKDGVGIEERSGSVLFISQVPEVHVQIDQLLDEVRSQSKLQVAMDIRLLRVSKNYYEEIGFDWQQGNDTRGTRLVDGNGISNGYNRQNNTLSYSAGVNNVTGLPSTRNQLGWSQFKTAGTPQGMVLDVSHSPFNFLNTDQVHFIFSAAENESDLQVLEHPQLTCFNGQRANAQFINQLQYISAYAVTSSNLDPTMSVLTYGNIIDLRPVVSSDRKYITLEVRPSSVRLRGIFTEIISASRVSGETNDINNGGTALVTVPVLNYPLDLPNVQINSLRSTVMLPDKGNLLIGGFTNSLREQTSVGIPFLSHIPFLGRLFSRNGSYDEDEKLFYLLHAEIVDLSEKESQQ